MAETLSIRKVLLVVDGTETGVRAARHAARLAALHGASLTALAVVDTATLKSLLKSSVLVDAEVAEFDQELGASARTNLDYAEQLAQEAGVSIEPILKKGSVHSVVIEQARALSPDLLVMGSFTSSLIKHDLNARERRLILDEAQCPVLLVP